MPCRTFAAASGIGGVTAPYSASVQNFAQRIIDAQGAGAATARSLDEGQGIALATAQSRVASASGVNIDEEMSMLPPPTTCGFAGILHEGLDGLPAEQVLGVPDDAPYRFGLAEAVSPLRMRGMVGMLSRIKRQVRLRREVLTGGGQA